MNLQGKTALVTGGAVRIGRAICEALAEQGCRLAVHYRDSADAAESLVKELQAKDCFAVAIAGNLSTPGGCAMVMDAAWRDAGPVDILVNNAAVFRRGPMTSASPEEVREVISVNLLAPLDLMRLFASRADSGRIVNLLDQRIATDHPGSLSYTVSKKALADATRLAAVELAPSFIVNGVAPGPVLPPPGRDAREAAGDVPLGAWPSPSDVAQAVIFLLKCDAVTGQTVFVDGGQHLR